MKPHARRFAEARSGEAGDPHQFDDDRRRILWVLAETNGVEDLSFLTPAQVSDILCECAGIDIPRQRVSAILEAERGTVAKRRIAKKRHFRIMKAGEDEVNSSALASTFIDPEKALTEIRHVEDLLSNLKGDLKICDPYVENKTLDFLAACSLASSLKLLTVNILKQSTFRRDLAAFQKEHGNRLDVRFAKQSHLHDRYIIHGDGLLLLGTSLNGFAKKQSFLVALGADLRSATETAFDRYWASATKF
jgi:hypothetical protein